MVGFILFSVLICIKKRDDLFFKQVVVRGFLTAYQGVFVEFI